MPDTTQQIHVFRHGATEWSKRGKHTGLTDVPLTADGRRNAEQLRPLLQGHRFTLVMSSPLQRAMDTCRLAGLGERAQVVDDLVEWDYGDYEGRTLEEIRRARPGWLVFKDGCPNGESPEDVCHRVDRVIERMRRVDGDVAVFAHGHVLRVLAARWLGLGPGHGRHFDLDTATYNILGYYHDSPAVLRWNAPLETGRLRADK